MNKVSEQLRMKEPGKKSRSQDGCSQKATMKMEASSRTSRSR